MAELRISLKPTNLRFTRVELAIIKAATPVRTGKLRRGWRIDANGDLVNRVDYAEFVEFGTRKMSARHFVQKAMGALLKSVTVRLLLQTKEGEKLLNAITLNVQRSGSFQAVFRKTINPKFYKHLLRTVSAKRRAQRKAS